MIQRTIRRTVPNQHAQVPPAPRKEASATGAPPPVKTSKISAEDRVAKERLKYLRKKCGLNMEQGARLLGLTRKQLEDVEAVKDYGCNLRWGHIEKATRVYQVSADVFLHDRPIPGEIHLASE